MADACTCNPDRNIALLGGIVKAHNLSSTSTIPWGECTRTHVGVSCISCPEGMAPAARGGDPGNPRKNNGRLAGIYFCCTSCAGAKTDSSPGYTTTLHRTLEAASPDASRGNRCKGTMRPGGTSCPAPSPPQTIASCTTCRGACNCKHVAVSCTGCRSRMAEVGRGASARSRRRGIVGLEDR